MTYILGTRLMTMLFDWIGITFTLLPPLLLPLFPAFLSASNDGCLCFKLLNEIGSVSEIIRGYLLISFFLAGDLMIHGFGRTWIGLDWK